MDILVIGNGFDLAHNLKTSYKDFLDFCNRINKQMVIDKDHLIYAECCQTNLWMKHFITRQAQMGNTWIHLENEIFLAICTILKKVSALRTPSKNDLTLSLSIGLFIENFDFSKIDQFISTSHNEYIRDQMQYKTQKEIQFYKIYNVYANSQKAFIKFLYDQLREFIKVFNTYLIYEVLNKIEDNNKNLLALQAIKPCTSMTPMPVLSFNYSDTCERLYKQKCRIDFRLDIETIYVHGKISNDNSCNLVLGTESFDNNSTIENTNLKIPVDFNIFKKYHQRHKYGTIESYQQLLKQINLHPTTFHVIGHSLDKTDHLILKHLFQANKDAKINIYYHDEESQERLINNIKDIIGEEDVMTRVMFINQYDNSRGLLKKYETLLSV